MTIRQLPSPRWTVPGSAGAIAAGFAVYTYVPGTSTAKDTYTDYTGAVANAWPVVLDVRGEGNIWWDGTNKVAVYTDTIGNGGTLVWSQDNYGEGDASVLQGNFNLVLNGSFEQDTDGDNLPDDWECVEYDTGDVVLSNEQIHGALSLKFTSVGAGGGYATSEYFEVEGSKVVPVSFAILASVATVHNQVDIIWYTTARAVISTTTLYNDTATNPTSWTDKNYVTTAPATARFARVRVFGCVDDDAQAGSTWFDNVMVEAAAISGLLPNVNSTVTTSDEELNFVDGVTSAIQTQLDAKLAAASYTAADVLAKTKTVDGTGSGLDADLVHGRPLYTGYFDSDAAPENTYLPAGWTVTYNGVGSFTITHNLNKYLNIVLTGNSGTVNAASALNSVAITTVGSACTGVYFLAQPRTD